MSSSSSPASNPVARNTSTGDNEPQYIYILRLEQGKYYVGRTAQPYNRIQQHFRGDGSSWTQVYPPIDIEMVRRMENEFDENNETIRVMGRYGIDNVRGANYSRLKLTSQEITHIESQLNDVNNRCFMCGKEGHFKNQCPSTGNSNISSTTSINNVNGFTSSSGTAAATNIHTNTSSTSSRTTSLNTAPTMNGKDASTGSKRKRTDLPPPADPNNHRNSRRVAGACQRCGRTSHTAQNCYATTDVDGGSIDSSEDDEDDEDDIDDEEACFRCGRTSHYARDCFANTDIHGNEI